MNMLPLMVPLMAISPSIAKSTSDWIQPGPRLRLNLAAVSFARELMKRWWGNVLPTARRGGATYMRGRSGTRAAAPLSRTPC